MAPASTKESPGTNGLCLLSLDGGGVKGLSTLYILKRLMEQINADRQREGLSYVKPCDIFDLIAGTSTGGIFAIMLGRLQMDVQETIDAYCGLSREVFSRKGLPVDQEGNVKGRFKSSMLEDSIKRIIRNAKSPEDAPLNDGQDRGCRVFVCAVRKENKSVAHLRSYRSNTAMAEDGATIWEACRATSAASSFFDPIPIGKHGQEYVDGGLGCNNPVGEVWTEAQDIWSGDDDSLSARIKCFISIGTGNPGTSPIEDNALTFLSKTLKEIATDTEAIARLFAKHHRVLLDQKRYYRFNVDQGLQNVTLEEYRREKEVVSAAALYMESQPILLQVRDCSQMVKDKASLENDNKTLTISILSEDQSCPGDLEFTRSNFAAPEIDAFVAQQSISPETNSVPWEDQFHAGDLETIYSNFAVPEVDIFGAQQSKSSRINSVLFEDQSCPGDPELAYSNFAAPEIETIVTQRNQSSETDLVTRPPLEIEQRGLHAGHYHDTMSSRGYCNYRARDKLRKTKKTLLEDLNHQIKTFGPTHLSTVDSLFHTGLLDRELSNIGEAVKHLEEAHEGFERVLGPSNPRTITALHELTRTRKVQEANLHPQSGLIFNVEWISLIDLLD